MADKDKVKELVAGEKVLIQATIVRRCCDNRPEDKRGYVVQTSRGLVKVEPDEIFFPLK